MAHLEKLGWWKKIFLFKKIVFSALFVQKNDFRLLFFENTVFFCYFLFVSIFREKRMRLFKFIIVYINLKSIFFSRSKLGWWYFFLKKLFSQHYLCKKINFKYIVFLHSFLFCENTVFYFFAFFYFYFFERSE